MTRQEFVQRLRLGLAGLPETARSEIVADYEAHFDEGAAAGRSEAEIAAALGDPDRLARELKAEAGLRRWEAERNPGGAAAAVVAVLGLGAVDVFVLLPVLVAVVSVICALYIGSAAGFVVGAVIFAAGPFGHAFGGPGATMLVGLGVMALSVFNGSVLTLISVGLVNALVWYGRLHFRLLKPALDPQPAMPTRRAIP
ncbi:MAG: DUF1700 domain-containing protein [Caulobacteraceae bacterium]